MTQQPDDQSDAPLGGSLSPSPDDLPEAPTSPDPAQAAAEQEPPPPPPADSGAHPYPPPPPPGAGGYPPPPPIGVPGGYPPPPPIGAPGAYPSAFPPGPGAPYAGGMGLRPGRGGVILALGIAGLLCCFPLSFVAFFLGRRDMAAMDAGQMDPSTRTLTNVGRILGIVGIAWLVLQTVFLVFNWGSITANPS